MSDRPHSFISSEHFLENGGVEQIDCFWNTGQFSSFTSKDNLKINYARFINDKSKPCILISPGRVESYIKYKELVFCLMKNGYNILILDHRGQGFSERILLDSHKGHVDKFNDYVADLEYFATVILPKYSTGKRFLLAHSMGAAISILMLIKKSNTFTSAILLAPMVGIKTGLMPVWLAIGISKLSKTFECFASVSSKFAFGQKRYLSKRFEVNKLSQSRIRYKTFRDIYDKYPEVQIGGITFNWFYQASCAIKRILQQSHRVSIPVLVIQAGADRIVNNSNQVKLCKKLNQGNSLSPSTPYRIDGAFHELLMESDLYRDKAIIKILNWFD
ncbi:MAG: alpha/beta fold hydrolase [Colwellia sp.]